MTGTTNMDLVSGTATCPSGTTVISGGAKILASNNGIPPYIALMTSQPSGNGWYALAREMQDNAGSAGTILTVTAVCATVAP